MSRPAEPGPPTRGSQRVGVGERGKTTLPLAKRRRRAFSGRFEAELRKSLAGGRDSAKSGIVWPVRSYTGRTPCLAPVKFRAMATHDHLLRRIRGEYREMPGLRLTFTQACRLWQIDRGTCHLVLDRLVADRFLAQAPDGSYTMFLAARPTPLKAELRPHADRPRQTRHRA